MSDFFPGGWQQDFDLLKHDARTYRNPPRDATGKLNLGARPAQLTFLQLALPPLLYILVEERGGERRKSLRTLPARAAGIALRRI
jgi:hypothetical protein